MAATGTAALIVAMAASSSNCSDADDGNRDTNHEEAEAPGSTTHAASHGGGPVDDT